MTDFCGRSEGRYINCSWIHIAGYYYPMKLNVKLAVANKVTPASQFTIVKDEPELRPSRGQMSYMQRQPASPVERYSRIVNPQHAALAIGRILPENPFLGRMKRWWPNCGTQRSRNLGCWGCSRLIGGKKRVRGGWRLKLRDVR